MAVRVDAAGHHQQAARVQLGPAFQPVGQGGDAAGADANIGGELVGSGDNGAAADD